MARHHSRTNVPIAPFWYSFDARKMEFSGTVGTLQTLVHFWQLVKRDRFWSKPLYTFVYIWASMGHVDFSHVYNVLNRCLTHADEVKPHSSHKIRNKTTKTLTTTTVEKRQLWLHWEEQQGALWLRKSPHSLPKTLNEEKIESSSVVICEPFLSFWITIHNDVKVSLSWLLAADQDATVFSEKFFEHGLSAGHLAFNRYLSLQVLGG